MELQAWRAWTRRSFDFAAGALCHALEIEPDAAPALVARLAAAERMAGQAGIGIAEAYGLRSQAEDPDSFDPFVLTEDEIVKRLSRAVDDCVIPDSVADGATVATQLASNAPSTDRPPARRVVLRILETRDERPVAGADIALADADGAVALGGLRTNAKGRVAFALVFDGDTPRAVDVAVFDPSGQQIADASVTLDPGVAETVVHVTLASEARPGDTGLREISDEPAVAQLAQRGIRTVAEVLRADDEIEGVTPDDLAAVRRAARWHAAGLDAREAETLRAFEFDGPLDVARIDRTRFLEVVSDRLGGPERAAAFHAGARLYEAHVARMAGDAWLRFGDETDPDDDDDGETDDDDFADIFDDLVECGCSDCNSALSPGAYLAHMLDWITGHVVSAGAPIRLDQLEDGFHQPFSDLTTDCDGVHDKFRQIRLAIEVLWPFTGGAPSGGETVFNGRYSDYRRAVYAAMLAEFDITHGDLLVAQAPDPALDDIRDRLAQRLGVAVGDLAEFVLAEAPDEATLQEVFGLRRTDLPHSAEVPMALALRLQLAELGRRWLAEDGDNDAWGPDQTQPAIDPRVIDETVIRFPRNDTNPVFVLYSERLAVLEAERATVAAAAGAAGLLAEITTRLGLDLAAMQALRDTLTGAVPATPEALADARAQVQDEVLLDLGAFLRVVEIAEALAAQGDAALDDPDVAADAADILVGRHARSLREDWITAETGEGITLSSALFHQPDLPDLLRPSLLVSGDLVAGWRAALQRRSSDPVIDPHHLAPADIVQFPAEGFDPFADGPRRDAATDLLTARQEWAEERRSALASARTGAGGVAAQYAAVMAASEVPDLQDRIETLLEWEEAGHDISRAVEQLAFAMPGFRTVVALGQRATAGLPLLPDQWRLIDDILVEVEERLRATEWRGEERERGICLHPRLFKQAELSRVAFDATDRPAFARRWARRWNVRDDAVNVAFTALERAVSEAETATLHILRDALIRRGPATGQSLVERAAELDARLLVAMDADGCHCTTRVAFAIETLQRFLRGVLDGSLTDALDNVEIDAENVLAAKSLLSYQEWRAALFAFLWPENLTSRLLPGGASHGLERLASNMPNRLSPPVACELAKAYEDYFDDIAGLEVSATCFAPAFVPSADPCDPGGATVADRLFLFGHAASGLVYWAMLDPTEAAGDTRTPWRPLSRLGPVTRLIGATLHGGQGEAAVVLLAEDSDNGAATLRLRSFDLGGRQLAGTQITFRARRGARDGLRCGDPQEVRAAWQRVQPGACADADAGGAASQGGRAFHPSLAAGPARLDRRVAARPRAFGRWPSSGFRSDPRRRGRRDHRR